MTRLILATAAAVMLGAPLALAANTAATPTMHAKTTKAADMSGRCTTLDAQFQKMEATHTDKTAKYYQDANALYREGSTMCKSNKQTAGAKYLNSAVKILEAHSKS
jgi:Ni/Co efflux regulator RcnB